MTRFCCQQIVAMAKSSAVVQPEKHKTEPTLLSDNIQSLIRVARASPAHYVWMVPASLTESAVINGSLWVWREPEKMWYFDTDTLHSPSDRTIVWHADSDDVQRAHHLIANYFCCCWGAKWSDYVEPRIAPFVNAKSIDDLMPSKNDPYRQPVALRLKPEIPTTGSGLFVPCVSLCLEYLEAIRVVYTTERREHVTDTTWAERHAVIRSWENHLNMRAPDSFHTYNDRRLFDDVQKALQSMGTGTCRPQRFLHQGLHDDTVLTGELLAVMAHVPSPHWGRHAQMPVNTVTLVTRREHYHGATKTPSLCNRLETLFEMKKPLPREEGMGDRWTTVRSMHPDERGTHQFTYIYQNDADENVTTNNPLTVQFTTVDTKDGQSLVDYVQRTAKFDFLRVAMDRDRFYISYDDRDALAALTSVLHNPDNGETDKWIRHGAAFAVDDIVES